MMNLSLPAPVLGDKTEPDMIPPDVTLPVAAPPQTLPSPSLSTTNSAGPPAPAASSTMAPDKAKKDPIAIMETSKGTIVIRLFRKMAPFTVANFVELSEKGFYNGLTFHRVEPGFVIQGGCPYGNGAGLYIDPATNKPRFLNLEIHPELKHNAPGVVAMANFGKNPNSASCQFYITLSAQPRLDGKYSIFGGVVNGMDVVNKIAKGDKIVSVKIEEQP